MKESLLKAMDDLTATTGAPSGEAGNDNQKFVASFDDIKCRAEALLQSSPETEVSAVIKSIFFSNIAGIQRASLIGIIASRTGLGKNAVKQELKKLKEENSIHPADPAMAVVSAFMKDTCSDGEHIRLGKDGRFWFYCKTHWEPLLDQDVWSKIVILTEKMFGQSKESLKTIAMNAIALLKAKVCDQHGVFDPYLDPKPVINCRNGEIWLKADGSWVLKKHDPESNQTYCLSVDYDQEAVCPEFDAALNGIFQNAEDPEGMIRHILEVYGYSLQPERDIPFYVVLFGPGRNGKSKATETLQSLIGKGGYHVDRVNKLEASRFTLASLAGKRIFVDDDVKEGTTLPDNVLKMISEGKEMSAEHKFKDRFMFVCRVVPFLLCNHYPNLTDLSVGMQRRAMVIPFAKTFSVDEADPDLFKRIKKNELSGVLNHALAGLKRLRERGKFLYPVDVEEANKDWFAQCSSLAAFIKQQCKHSANSKEKIQDLYLHYEMWTEGQGFKHVTPRYKIKSELKALGYTVKDINGLPHVYGLKYEPDNMMVFEPTVSQEEHDDACSSL